VGTLATTAGAGVGGVFTTTLPRHKRSYGFGVSNCWTRFRINQTAVQFVKKLPRSQTIRKKSISRLNLAFRSETLIVLGFREVASKMPSTGSLIRIGFRPDDVRKGVFT
jgi:hypothetical protein